MVFPSQPRGLTVQLPQVNCVSLTSIISLHPHLRSVGYAVVRWNIQFWLRDPGIKLWFVFHRNVDSLPGKIWHIARTQLFIRRSCYSVVAIFWQIFFILNLSRNSSSIFRTFLEININTTSSPFLSCETKLLNEPSDWSKNVNDDNDIFRS